MTRPELWPLLQFRQAEESPNQRRLVGRQLEFFHYIFQSRFFVLDKNFADTVAQPFRIHVEFLADRFEIALR